MKGRFTDSEAVIGNETKALHISENEFDKCFGQLFDRWGKFISAGEYFEGK